MRQFQVGICEVSSLRLLQEQICVQLWLLMPFLVLSHQLIYEQFVSFVPFFCLNFENDVALVSVCKRYVLADFSKQIRIFTEETPDHLTDTNQINLPARMLRVGDRVADDILEEYFQHSSRLLVDEARDALHSTSASQSPDCRLRDTLDVIS